MTSRPSRCKPILALLGVTGAVAACATPQSTPPPELPGGVQGCGAGPPPLYALADDHPIAVRLAALERDGQREEVLRIYEDLARLGYPRYQLALATMLADDRDRQIEAAVWALQVRKREEAAALDLHLGPEEHDEVMERAVDLEVEIRQKLRPYDRERDYFDFGSPRTTAMCARLRFRLTAEGSVEDAEVVTYTPGNAAARKWGEFVRDTVSTWKYPADPRRATYEPLPYSDFTATFGMRSP